MGRHFRFPMGAIAGFYGLDGRLAKADQLDRMVATLSHRGPDGRATWVDGPVGLGHCMLYTTPESLHETLPRRHGGLVITADARIDNREELIGLLGLDSIPPGEISDSDLILLAYQKWGEQCPERLLGDFAFAIHDGHNHQLFCARDHVGVRPFYYKYEAGRRFVFSTEIKGILGLEDVRRRLAEAKIADYMLGFFEDKTRTFFEDISRLPPASAMVISSKGIRIREYWASDPNRELRLKSNAEYAEAFREIFKEAVRCRLRSAFPVGSMLSGGLDSSSVSCVAHDFAAPRGAGELHTFSIVFGKIKKSDERPFIDKVLADRKFVAHFVYGDEATPFDDLDTVLQFQDEPFFAPNLFLARRAWQSANSNGVRVLLEGLLGDNIVSHGVEYLNELARRLRWLSLARELKQIIRKSNSCVPLWKPFGRYVVQEGIRPHIPEKGLAFLRMIRRAPTDRFEEQCRLFSSEYLTRTDLRKRLVGAYERSRTVSTSRQSHWDSLNSGMVETALEIYNKGCGEFAIEPRFPFADKRLIEYCLAVPGAQRIGDGYTRAVFRRAMQGILPEDVRCRTDKGDMESSFTNGFRLKRDLVDATIRSSHRFLDRFFDARRLGAMCRRFMCGKVDADEQFALFLVVVLATWGARFASI